MSSGTPQRPAAARNMLGGLADKVTDKSPKNADDVFSPRQRELEWYWKHYRCIQYAAHKVDWDGKEVTGKIDHEVVATTGQVPPGFYDAGATLPIKFRKPTAPYYLLRVIVDRFTGLLFGSSRHPQVKCAGAPATEDIVNAIVESGRLWATMLKARTFGGATGSACIGFKLVNGKPTFEVFDPRFCTPTFFDPATQELSMLEVRYTFTEDVRDPYTGEWTTETCWYRRLIDATTDTVWPKVPVGDWSEPKWEHERYVPIVHGLSEHPAVWIQNIPVEGEVDGDPDCLGCYEIMHTADMLIAQANRGIVANCTPQLTVATDDEVDSVATGPDKALVTSANGKAAFVEISGTGPKAAVELADRCEARVLKTARCVVEESRTTGSKTATELTQDYSSMYEKADVLREQYGEKGVKRLLEKVMRIIAAVTKKLTVVPTTGQVVRRTVVLPPKLEHDGAEAHYAPRDITQLQPDVPLELKWPPYVKPTMADIQSATTAVSAAFGGGVLDLEEAVRFIAPFYGVEDPRAMIERLSHAAHAQLAADAEYANSVMDRSRGALPAKKEDKAQDITAYALDDGAVTLDEFRAAMKLGPMPDGHLTLPQYKAKYPELFKAAAAADAADPKPGGANMRLVQGGMR